MSRSAILRVIWTCGKARTDHWAKEVTLLREEMRCTLTYCEWKFSWWEQQVASCSGLLDLREGSSTYAIKQSEMWKTLGDRIDDEWTPLIHQYNLPSDWPE